MIEQRFGIAVGLRALFKPPTDNPPELAALLRALEEKEGMVVPGSNP